MIVALQGGLGNQMFQYAFGVSVARQRGEKVYFSRSRVDADPKREYALDPFNLPIEFAEEKEPFYYDNYLFDPGVYSAPKDSTFVGHWQTEKYFDVPMVRQMFNFSQIRRLGRWNNYCFVHVRRKDYLSPEALAYHGVPSIDYYNRAMQVMKERNPHVGFGIFSDDPLWCVNAFDGLRVISDPHSGDAPVTDLLEMSIYGSGIIANSSYSWWSAWLSDGFIIAPKRWYVAGPMERDICPERWIRLEN